MLVHLSNVGEGYTPAKPKPDLMSVHCYNTKAKAKDVAKSLRQRDVAITAKVHERAAKMDCLAVTLFYVVVRRVGL